MIITVRQLRVTSIYLEVYPTVMEKTLAKDSRLGQLARESRYEQPYDDALRGNGSLRVPWNILSENGDNFFWKYYLDAGSSALNQTSAKKAWKWLVPLQEAPIRRFKLAPQVGNGGLSIKLNYYPHGIALAATVTLNPKLNLEESVKCVSRIHKGDAFYSEDSGKRFKLDRLCGELLTAARHRVFGNTNVSRRSRSKPFTVATVVDGNLPNEYRRTRAEANGDPVHRAMDGLCTFDERFVTHELDQELAESKLPIQQSDASHFLYARQRARSVWFPAAFDSSGPRRSLGCYHQNLVSVSMQTEAILELLGLAASAIRNNILLPTSMQKLCRAAAGRIAQIFAGTRDTYRSASARRQILRSDRIDDVNFVRTYLNCGEPISDT